MDLRNRTNYSRWAAESEIKKSLSKARLGGGEAPHGGIPLYSDTEGVYVDRTDTHSLIIGSTGSKKTRLVGMPALLLYAAAGESFIATDPKAELYERTLPLLKRRGYRTFVLNLRDPARSNAWNPLEVPYRIYLAGQRDKAVEMVNDMAGCITNDGDEHDSYWENSAANMLAGLILTLFECGCEGEVHFKSLRALRAEAYRTQKEGGGREGEPFIKHALLDRLDKTTFVASLLSGSADVCADTRSCIVSVFDQRVQPFFNQDNLIDMMSGSDIEMGEIGREKTAVFLIMPDENTLYHRLVSVFVKQCYTELILAAQREPDRRLPRRVNFLLDEFCTLPPIKDFPAMVTASRSRNIRFNLIIQSMSQLYRQYGNDAGTIKANCENWVFLHSRELSLLQELSEMCGTVNGEAPLVSVSTLQTLDKDKGEAFVLHKRLRPYIACLPDIDRYPGAGPGAAQAEYPENGRKAGAAFSLRSFCSAYKDWYYRLLFTGRKPEQPPEKDESDYMTSEADIAEPIFVSRPPEEGPQG